MPKINEKVSVTIKPAATGYGFDAESQYEATKVSGGGYSLINDDGQEIVLPAAMLNLAPPKRATPKAGPATSQAEEAALVEALTSSKSKPQQQKKAAAPKGVLSKILEQDNEPEQPTMAAIAEDVEKQELIRKRKRLIPPAQVLLQEGQCWLSDLTDGELPESGVDHIITSYRWDHFPDHLRQDIPDFDIYHEWNPDVLENLILSHEENLKNLLVGYPGSGKSSSVRNFAALILQPFMPLNGKDGIDGSSFLGFLVAGPGGTEFNEGLLPVAMRNGYLMCIDEVFKIPADIQMNFQTVYQENGFLLLDEKPGTLHDKLVKPHPDFRLVGTDNAKGTGDNFDKFGATQVQDTSTLDRFGLTENVPYLPQDKEVECLNRMYDLPVDTLERFVRTANMVREAYTKSDVALTLSMRGLKVMCRLYERGLSEAVAYKKAYVTKLSEEDEINLAISYSNAVGLDTASPIKSPAEASGFTKSAAEYIGTPMPWDTDE